MRYFETASLRQKPLKFSRADQIFSRARAGELPVVVVVEPIAAYRASRYQQFGTQVADLCCGIGGDAIGFECGSQCDWLRHRSTACRHGVTTQCRGRTPGVVADATGDTDRRRCRFSIRRRDERGQARIYSVQHYHPAIVIDRWQAITPHIGVKISPCRLH